MTFIQPITLNANGIVLTPLDHHHEAGLREAAADGELWSIRVTSVPAPGETDAYIEKALEMRRLGTRFALSLIHI